MNGGGIARPQRGSNGISYGGRYPHMSTGGGIGGLIYISPPSSYLKIHHMVQDINSRAKCREHDS